MTRIAPTSGGAAAMRVRMMVRVQAMGHRARVHTIRLSSGLAASRPTPDVSDAKPRLVELKAVQAIGPIEQMQLIIHFRVARRNRGLILNFPGTTSLQHKRLVLDLTNDPADQSSRA
jgi:hypothetical protein